MGEPCAESCAPRSGANPANASRDQGSNERAQELPFGRFVLPVGKQRVVEAREKQALSSASIEGGKLIGNAPERGAQLSAQGSPIDTQRRIAGTDFRRECLWCRSSRRGYDSRRPSGMDR